MSTPAETREKERDPKADLEAIERCRTSPRRFADITEATIAADIVHCESGIDDHGSAWAMRLFKYIRAMLQERHRTLALEEENKRLKHMVSAWQTTGDVVYKQKRCLADENDRLREAAVRYASCVATVREENTAEWMHYVGHETNELLRELGNESRVQLRHQGGSFWFDIEALNPQQGGRESP